MMSENPYHVLEISEEADLAAIKKAYFSKIKQFPPDKEPEAFKRIRKAYETLQQEVPTSKKVGGLHQLSLEKQEIPEPLEVLQNAQKKQNEVSINQFIKITF
ncbi:DnaJ domain-containing protein [Deltaproteobacteria bacterium TL4]